MEIKYITCVLATTTTIISGRLPPYLKHSHPNNWVCPNLGCGRMGLAPHDHTGMTSVLFTGTKSTEKHSFTPRERMRIYPANVRLIELMKSEYQQLQIRE